MSRPTKEGGLIAVKFGGTSMANPDTVGAAINIVQSHPNRRFITVSAPGNGDKNDPMQNFRVTKALQAGQFEKVWARFDGMARDVLGAGESYDRIARRIEKTRRKVASVGVSPYAESRGEDFQGRIMAEKLGIRYLDPLKYVFLNDDNTVHQKTYRRLREGVKPGERVLLGGYFGVNINTGEVQILPKGSTDYTGAFGADALGAVLYENYTDVDGVFAADPRIVPHAQGVPIMTRDEMGEMGHRGAGILQVDAVEPVEAADIPINIRNTFNPDHPGTMVVGQRISLPGEQVIGIASREGFVSFQVGKPGMARRPGALASITGIFAEEGISLEQGPGGRNHVSFIAHSDQFPNGTDQTVMRRIRNEVNPTTLSLVNDIGLVAVIGQRLATDATHVNAVMYPALSEAHIRTGAHIQSELPNSVVFSVANRDVNRTVNVLYDALIR